MRAFILGIALLAGRALGPIAEVPFKWTPGQIEVAVRVNDAPATFLLDTGAEYSIVSTQLAERLGLKTEPRGQRTFADDVELDVGGAVRLPHQRVMVMPFTTYYDRGRRIDGLVGCDFFRRFVVAIEFSRRRLRLWQPADFAAPRKAVVVPLEFAGRLPLVPVAIRLRGGELLGVRLLVDTGASQGIFLRYPFAEAHGLLDLGGRSSSAPSLADGVRRLIDVPADEVRVASWTFNDVPVRAFAEPTGSAGSTASDGLMGNTVLQRFTMYVDYPHARLLLERAKASR